MWLARAARGTRAESADCLRAFGSEIGFLYRSLRRHGVRPADAEDLVQDVFLVMWRRWGEYQPSRPLRPWLAGIVYKIAHRHVDRRRRFALQEAPEIEDPRPGQEEQLARAHASALVTRALDRLPAEQRAALVMHDLDGVPVREVARLQEVPLFTAYNRLRSARRKLADAIAEGTVSAAGGGREPTRLPAVLALVRAEPELPSGLGARLLARARAATLDPASAGLGAGAWPATGRSARLARRFALPLVGGVGLSLLVAAIAAFPRAAATPPTLEESRPRGAGPARQAPARAGAAAVRPFLAPPLAPQAEPPPARRDPIARWGFDEPPGSPVARDGSGSGHDCLLRRRGPAAPDTQGAWTEGLTGGALALDGRHWLECPAFDRPGHLESELTIAVWMRVASGPAGKRVLVTCQLGTTGDRVFSLRLADGNVELLSHVWEKLLRKRYGAAGQWIHVAAVRELGRTRLYLDGALVTGNRAPAPRPLGGAGTALLIGGQIDGPEPGGAAKHLFRGDLDELAIYDRALGPDEVRALATPPASMTARFDSRRRP